MESKLMTAAEVAQTLTVSVRTVRNMVERGELEPPIKVGGRSSRWRSEAVLEYLIYAKIARRVETACQGQKPRIDSAPKVRGAAPAGKSGPEGKTGPGPG